MKITLILFWTFFGINTLLHAQYTGDITPVNPITPNEAAMFKPVAQPIGNFSGMVPVDIPLFTAGRPNLPVSVNLSYNASGFKVEEFASSVGLGWNLSVGGSITRIIHGLADDLTGGYIDNPAYKPSQVLGYSTYSQLEPVWNDVRNQGLDLQPDEFFFTCNGLSGRLFFDENKTIHVEDNNGITITAKYSGGTGNGITGWVLTDNNGNRYYFGGGCPHTSATSVDQNIPSFSSNNGYSNLPPPQIYNIDWHLLEIDDVNANVMATFTYARNENYVTSRLQAYMKLQTAGTLGCVAGQTYTADETFAQSEIYESIVTSITTPVDKITFYYDYNRIDDQGEPRYDSIRQTDLSGNLKKMYHFNYGYFYQPYFPTGQDAYYKRLELLNVAEFGASGSDSIATGFDYNTTYNLPSRYSRGQDYWGYYNGQDANWTLMPNGSYTAMGVTVSEGSLGERRPSFLYASANMLTKIHFPTKGTRAFTYEANQYLWDPSSSATPDAGYYQYKSIYASTFNTTGSPQYDTTFTISDQSGGTTWNYYIDGCCFYGSYAVKILQGFTTLMTFSNQLSGSMSLQNGTYTVQFTYDVYNCTIYDFNAYWNQLQMNTATQVRFGRSLQKDNMTGPGVRVKEVDDYDPISGQTISTYYQYNQFADSTHTSGLLINPVCVLTDMSCLDCDYIRLAANSNYPLAQQGGNFVNYTDVRTYQTGNGHTDQQYSFDFDNMQGDPIGTLSVPQDNSWERGKLLCSRAYDNNNTLLREDSTVYIILAGNSTFYMDDYDYYDTVSYSDILFKKTFGFKSMVWLDPVYTGLLDYCYNAWCLSSQFCQPDYTISHIYTPYGSQTEQTNYSYWTGKGQPFLQQQQHYLNNNTTQLINYRYTFNSPPEFKLPMSPADTIMKNTLLTLHYLRPIEMSQYKQQATDTSFVEGTHYGFTKFTFNTTYYLPTLARHYTTKAAYTDMNYGYDSTGNLAEEYRTGGPHTIWIWGYTYTQPVAKIIGATNYSTARSYANNTLLQSPTSDNDIRTQVNNIRSGLASSKAQVTTFTWTPVFGMTSQVDPAGIATYYEYDNHGRLLTIRDQYSNIIKRYNYSLNNP